MELLEKKQGRQQQQANVSSNANNNYMDGNPDADMLLEEGETADAATTTTSNNDHDAL